MPASSTQSSHQSFMPSPVMLQSCGKKTSKRPWIKGPDAPPNAVFLNCTNLPNPHGKFLEYEDKMRAKEIVQYTKYYREVDVAKFFLYENAGDKLKRLVERGKAAVNAGNPVVAQCAYGKHRSRAVLELIGDSFHSSRIYYVHRECM